MIGRSRRRARESRAVLLRSLKESEARFEAAADSAPVLLWVSDAAGSRTWYNQAWLSFTGRAVGEELGDGWIGGVHPTDRDRCLETYRAALTRRAPFELEYRLRRHDGVYRWMLDRGRPRLAPDGSFVGFIGSGADVTEQRSALESSRHRERQKELAAELGRRALQQGLGRDMLADACHQLRDVMDAAAVEAWEITDAADGLVLRARADDDDDDGQGAPVAPDLVRFTLKQDVPVLSADFSTESRFDADALLPSGMSSGLAVVVRTDAGQFGSLVAYSREIAAFVEGDDLFLRNVANILGAAVSRERIENELRLRELENSLVSGVGRVGAWRWDPSDDLVWWSPEMERIYGLEVGSFGGRLEDFAAQIHPDDRAEVFAHIQEATTTGNDLSFVHRAVRPDGQVVWLDSRGARIDVSGGAQHWIGVGIDITDRKRADQDRLEREIEARLALSAGRMGSWRWDAATNTGSWSPELEQLMGLEPGGFNEARVSFVDLIVEEDRGVLRAAALEAVEHDRELAAEYRVRRPDGSLRWLESRGRRISGNEWIGVTIDITDRKTAEDELQVANVELASTVARLDTLLGYAPTGFAFFDLEFRFLRLNDVVAELSDLPADLVVGQPLSAIVPELWERLHTWLERVVETGEPLVDVEISGRLSELVGVERHWLGSFYPVFAEGQIIGLGMVIVEITERKRQERRTRLLGAASELHGLPLDFESTLQHAADVVVPEFCDSSVLFVSPRSGLAEQVAFAHADESLAEAMRDARARWSIDLGELIAGMTPPRAPYLVEEMRPEIIDRVIADRDEWRSLVDLHGVRSVIVAPLRARGRTIGTAVFTTTPLSNRRFQTGDLETAGELSRRLAQLIDNAYLAREATRAQSRLDLLAQVSELLTVDLDSEARSKAVVDIVIPTFADVAAVFLQRDEATLDLVAFSSSDPKLQRRYDEAATVPTTTTSGEGPVASAFATGAPVLISEIEEGYFERLVNDPAIVALIRSMGLRSIVSVPLPGPEGAIGVMSFGYTTSGRRYSDVDVPLARELALRLAPAVENALRFERQSETAEALQRSLLPEQLPRLHDADLIARYLPGTAGIKVGGDWYDAIQVDGGRTVLAIGDVVGHGVRAAASMGRLRNVAQFCALDGLSPATMLYRLNEYFCGLADADMATLLVAVHEPATRKLCYASAGHLPPAIRGADGTVTFLEEGRGLPLCASEGATYREAEACLPAGALLCLYTDGLVERRGESLDVGLGRLERELSTTLGDDLEAEADRLVVRLLDDTVQVDDVALLMLRPHPDTHDLRMWFMAAPRELGNVRRVLAGWLTRLGVGDEEAGEIVVAANEAAANAIEHAYGLERAEFSIIARMADDVVEVVVRDSGRWRAAPSASDRGRGLDLARRLMDEVEIGASDDGTTVAMRRRRWGSG